MAKKFFARKIFFTRARTTARDFLRR